MLKNGCCTAEELEKVHADKNSTDLEQDLSYRVRGVLGEKIFKDEKFRSKFDELMSKKETKVHITNKLYFICNMEGLAARLLGYDAIINERKNLRHCDCDGKQSRFKHYCIVNPKNVTMCSGCVIK